MNTEPAKVLLVEDCFIISLDMADQLSSLGHRVLGPCHSLAESYSLLEKESPDVALLDLNLDGESAVPLAEKLRSLGVPFAFMSGYEPGTMIPESLSDALLIVKPATEKKLKTAINHLTTLVPR